jgi:osmotically-inducible protein OsmY
MTNSPTDLRGASAGQTPTPEQDERLRDAVLERLRSSGYLLLRRVRCEVRGGVVTLSGDLPSFHLKQLAQALLTKIGSVRQVRNLVEVRPTAGMKETP